MWKFTNSISFKINVLVFGLVSVLILITSLSVSTFNDFEKQDRIEDILQNLLISDKAFIEFEEYKKQEYIDELYDAIYVIKKDLEFLADENVEHIDTILNVYENNFSNYVVLKKKRGLNEKLGFEGNFNASANRIIEYLEPIGRADLDQRFLSIRVKEKEYLLSSKMAIIPRIRDEVRTLKNLIIDLNIDDETKNMLRSDLNTYLESLMALKDVSNQLDVQRSSLQNVQRELRTELSYYSDMISKDMTALRSFMIIFFFFILISVIIITIRFTRNIIQPLKSLSDFSAKVTEKGLSIRSDVTSDDEIGKLTLSLNKMMDKIESDVDKIKSTKSELEKTLTQKNDELHQEIEERKVYEDKLKETFNRLTKLKSELQESLSKEKELNELKSRFVSMVSHEYRTPLTILQTSIFILEQLYSKRDDLAFKERLQKMEKTILGMKVLLEDTVNIQKVENGNLEVKKEKVNVKELVSEIIESVKDIKKEGQKIIIEENTIKEEIKVDPNLLKHCLFNLTNNAIKYSPERSLIIIELNDFKEGIRLKVKDHGIGIPIEDQEHLFTPFHRSHNTVGIQGTGLGLTLTKQFVEAMGGDISFKSKEKEGSTFVLTLFDN